MSTDSEDRADVRAEQAETRADARAAEAEAGAERRARPAVLLPTHAAETEDQRRLDFKDKIIIIMVILMLILVGYVMYQGQATKTVLERQGANSVRIKEQNEKLTTVLDTINELSQAQACSSDTQIKWEGAVGDLLVQGVTVNGPETAAIVARIKEATKALNEARALCSPDLPQIPTDTTPTPGG